MMLTSNFVIAHTSGSYFGRAAETNPLVNIWSLSVEEQFYLIFPFLLFVVWRLASRRSGRPMRAGLIVLALVSAGSFALAVVQSFGLDVNPFPGYLQVLLDPFYSPIPRVWEFGAGAAIALLGARATLPSPRAGLVSGILGSAGIVLSVALINRETAWPGLWTVLPVAATVLLILSGTAQNPISRFLSIRPMAYVGDISYSVYLWHWPLIVLATHIWADSALAAPLAAALSFLPAIASYHLLEQPVRTLPFTTWPRFFRLLCVVSVPPLLLAASLYVGTKQGFWNPEIRHQQQLVAAKHPAEERGCHQESWKTRENCVFEGEEGLTGAPIYLVGDSQADHFTLGLEKAGTQLGRPVQVLSEYGCGLVPTELTKYDEERERRCATWDAQTHEFLETAQPGTVVIATSYLEMLDRVTRTDHASGLSVEEKKAALEEYLLDSVAQFQAAGHDVMLL